MIAFPGTSPTMDHYATDQMGPAGPPPSTKARRRQLNVAVTFAKLPPVAVPTLSVTDSEQIAESWTRQNSTFAAKVGLNAFGPCACFDPPGEQLDEEAEYTKRRVCPRPSLCPRPPRRHARHARHTPLCAR